MEPLAGAAPAGSPYKGDLHAAAERQRKWWPARVTRPVLRIKSPLHHFNACRPEDGSRCRIRTCTGDVLNVVSLLLDYARKDNWGLPPVLPRHDFLTKEACGCRKEANGRSLQCCPGQSGLMKPA